MAIFAEIQDGRVANVAVADNLSGLPSNLTWIDLTQASPMPGIGWSYEGGKFVAPPQNTPAVPLATQAAAALEAVRIHVYNNYGILNESTPATWVTYLKALMAIASGTDTTSTALPTQPTDIMTAS